MKYLTSIFLTGLTLLVVGCNTSTEVVKDTPKNCTLSGGEVVEAGWSGKDTGSNFCNQCSCMQEGPNMGGLVCTEMACAPNTTSKAAKAQDQYQKYDNSEMPKLHNLGIMNLGPYNEADGTFGDLLFDTSLTLPIFIEFGASVKRVSRSGQSYNYANPNFEFRGPAETVVVAPIDGLITQLTWQPADGYVQDDWEIIISPTLHSSWGVSIDHIVSIDCDREGAVPIRCDQSLQIGGVNVEIGTEVKAGDVIGYIGNWMENGTKINGRTEITLFQYIENYETRSINTVSYCPTLSLAKPVESQIQAAVVDLMAKYEIVHEQEIAYDESSMVAPGCLKSTVEKN